LGKSCDDSRIFRLVRNTNITRIDEARLNRIKDKTYVVDQVDSAKAPGLLCSAAQMHLGAVYLLDTGRIDLARQPSDAADLARDVYERITPPALPISTANECLERP
jgi:hypothetical protein